WRHRRRRLLRGPKFANQTGGDARTNRDQVLLFAEVSAKVVKLAAGRIIRVLAPVCFNELPNAVAESEEREAIMLDEFGAGVPALAQERRKHINAVGRLARRNFLAGQGGA